MRLARIFLAVSVGVALAAACGGSSTTTPGRGSTGDAGGSSNTEAGNGSSSGSGATTGSGGAGGLVTEGGAIVPAGVPCGMLYGETAYCPTTQICCITFVRPDAGRGPVTESDVCVADLGSCQAGATVTACTGSSQCGGKICCAEPGDGGAQGPGAAIANTLCEDACSANGVQICESSTDCATGQTCEDRGGARVCVTPPCTGPASCAAGQVCCTGMAGGRGMAPGGNTCAATCPMGSVEVCGATADCPSGQTCNMGAGGEMTCGTPPCTAGSCGAGMVCCTAAGGGAACQATDAGTCTAGRVVCATAADCPTPGDVCAAAGGGAGAMILSCRPAPLMPRVDAGSAATMEAGTTTAIVDSGPTTITDACCTGGD